MLFNGVLQALQRRCISLLRHIAVGRVQAVLQAGQRPALRGQILAVLLNGVLQALQRRCISLLRHIAVSRVQAVLQAGQRPTLRGQIPAMLFNGVLQALQRVASAFFATLLLVVFRLFWGWSGCLLRFQTAFGSRHAGRQIRQRAGIGLAADILTKLRHIRLQFRDRAALRRNILPVLRD